MAFTAKTDWAKGDVLPHTEMNRIEQGVKDAHSELEGKQNSKDALKLGTTSTTAKRGDYAPDWASITSKPATFAPTIGATATTAAAGNHNHAVTDDAASGLAAAATIQALAVALSARIKVLEDAAAA